MSPKTNPPRAAGTGQAAKGAPRNGKHTEPFVAPPSTPDADTPEYLVPRMGKVGIGEPAYYRSLYILDTLGPGADGEALTRAIDPFDERCLAPLDGLRPAFGVLTVHEQVWKQTGIGLGNLLQSVCLAPGEVTQVAVTRWERKARGSSTELTSQSEAASHDDEQQRAVNEVQRAVARETQAGMSSASSSSHSAQGGFSIGFFGHGSAATTSSSALTAQFSSGSRDLAAESTHAIAQRTAERSQSLRSRRQSVVKEISEQEDETTSTRVLANYNRRHSLNILFFEVLQNYRVKTVLAEWERCLFVPLAPLDFSKKETLVRHQAELVALFEELGAPEWIEHLRTALGAEELARRARAECDQQLEALEKALQLALRYQVEAQEVARLKAIPNEPVPVGQAYTGAFRARRLHAVRVLNEQLVAHLEQQREIETQWATAATGLGALPAIGSAADYLRSAIDAHRANRARIEIPDNGLFQQHGLFLSQQLWLRMSRYDIYRMLQKYAVPGEDGAARRPLSAAVDPQPVGVFGNYLAFRWGFPRTVEGAERREKFRRDYLGSEPEPEPRRAGPAGTEVKAEEEGGAEVSLPTSGIFAEAVLGQALAAERRDDRFHPWSTHDVMPILPPRIADVVSRNRAQPLDLGAHDLAAPLAQLRATQLSDVSYLEKIIAAAGKGDTFRDMGGLAQTVALAQNLAALSKRGATEAGDRAVKLQTKIVETMEKVLESPQGQAALANMIVPGSGAAVAAARNGKATAADGDGKAASAGGDGEHAAEEASEPEDPAERAAEAQPAAKS